MVSQPLLQQLRACTHERHLALEQAFDRQQWFASVERYRGLLGRWWQFFSALDTCWSRHDVQGTVLDAGDSVSAAIASDCHQLPQLAWLKQDLLDLDGDALIQAGVFPCNLLPESRSIGGRWGCQYVLRGSMLGAQVLRRRLREQLDWRDDRGCRFLLAYGPETALRWQDFCSRLNAFGHAAPEAHDDAIRSARATFDCLGEWITQ